MKRRVPSRSRTPTRPDRRGAGTATGRSKPKPTPGWKGAATARVGWRNPRTPAVPATLDLRLDEYFTASSLLGLLASQIEEPNKHWVRDWSFAMGEIMATSALRRRKKRA